jgi:hypothetical protein
MCCFFGVPRNDTQKWSNPKKCRPTRSKSATAFFDKKAARIVAALKQVAADDQSRNDQKNGQRRLTKEMVACFPLCMFSSHTK